MIELKPLKLSQNQQVIKLITEVFSVDISQENGSKNTKPYLDRISDDVLACFKNERTFYLGAFYESNLVGVIGYSIHGHISQLFINQRFQKQGIGTALIHEALNHIKSEHITVNASLNAWRYYTKFGFSVVNTIREHLGIQYLPMKLTR
jgi:GNAT superfamily N-acetyltransferase